MTRVLVLDDEVDICMMICSHLQKLHFEAEYAVSVKEGISKINASVFQLIFLDIDLKDGSGVDLISHLQKAKSNLKIIVISGYHNEVSKAMEMGASLFITKPFSIKTINEALRTLNFLSL
jgi:DNA-binding NtrC family response regulator